MQRRVGSLIVIISAMAVMCVLALEAGAQALSESEMQRLLTEANDYFRDANEKSVDAPEDARELYGRSILRFERIVKDGGIRNGRLYYNLGNAYFLSGDTGRAMVNYLRALQHNPNDANLLQNIAYVRDQRIDRIDEPQRVRVLKTLFFWHHDLATMTRTIAFCGLYCLVWIFACIRLFVRTAALSWATALSVVFCLILLGSLSVEAVSVAQDATGVIVAEEVVARKGDSESYQPSFEEPLHGGTEFTLLERREDWLQVKLRDGRHCWISEACAEMVQEEPNRSVVQNVA